MKLLVAIVCLALLPCRAAGATDGAIDETKNRHEWETMLMDGIGIQHKLRRVEEMVMVTLQQMRPFCIKI